MPRVILVAIGSNLPGPGGRTPLETCRWAVSRVTEVPGLSFVACSTWYRSAPVPPSGQPDYVNGVARFAGELEPKAVLDRLQAIEAEAGRVRSVPNAARELDLDLLAVDDLVVSTARLTLPHPRLQDRAFVLAPLCDVAPGWTMPDGRRAAALLATADRTGLSVLSGA